MGKRRRKHHCREQQLISDFERAFDRDIQHIFQHEMLKRVLGRFAIPPPPPPGFGIERPELRYQSPLVTGQTLFDDPFHTVHPPPPFGPADPCYDAWVRTLRAAQARINACPLGEESEECTQAREAYFEASRQYANCMDLQYGKQQFQSTGQQTGTTNKKTKSNKKNRT